MEQIKLSIIIPVFNGVRFVEDCFARFERQKGEFEIICIDDGSEDGSYEKIVAEAEKASFPVILHKQPNMGVSAARNAGVEKANGEYIAFVDIDDVVADDYVKTIFKCMDENVPVAVFKSQRVIKSSWEKPKFEERVIRKRTIDSLKQLDEFLADPTRLCVYNLLLRHDFINKNNIRFAEGYKYYEDYDFLLQIFAQASNITQIDEVLYYYVLQEGSAMGRFTVDRLTCLELMQNRGLWLFEKAPDFAKRFEKWGISRIYWSVLWQAAVAFRSYKQFLEFAEESHALIYLKKLRDYPECKVQISSLVFGITPFAYWVVVRKLGRMRSKVKQISLDEYKGTADIGVIYTSEE